MLRRLPTVLVDVDNMIFVKPPRFVRRVEYIKQALPLPTMWFANKHTHRLCQQYDVALAPLVVVPSTPDAADDAMIEVAEEWFYHTHTPNASLHVITRDRLLRKAILKKASQKNTEDAVHFWGFAENSEVLTYGHPITSMHERESMTRTFKNTKR